MKIMTLITLMICMKKINKYFMKVLIPLLFITLIGLCTYGVVDIIKQINKLK